MCFSTSASFTVSTFLLSSGFYCLSHLGTRNTQYLPMTTIPILFGIQQFCEGMVWLEINNLDSSLSKIYALGFLFFSHYLWLFWMAFAVLVVETRRFFRRILAVFTVVGIFYGSVLYFPLLLHPEQLSVNIWHGAIAYQATLLGAQFIPSYLGIFIYASISLIPLLISESRIFQNLGWLIFVALIFTKTIFSSTVVSTWCFFAAIISVYLVYVCLNDLLPNDSTVA
ncbi:DUF6629 family protein [Gloeocapsa sp. PCC 73106]|uniref:DUF6629 family protein n=1 Tax=Gloeocapsa sp. PCC 73106 TaxID=102232 RepID=UPI0002ACEEA4|nr:DUF6629 family protein [Gloeocapsa sp. PCC 73106]ELS00118.1 hypothetical protein GLO73106DRAFT_00039730 [Gloeocapsa sp. PCC 73106]